MVDCIFWRHYCSADVYSDFVLLQLVYFCVKICKIFIMLYVDDFSATVAQQLGSRKVEAIAFVLHNSQSAIHISGKDEAVYIFHFVTSGLA